MNEKSWQLLGIEKTTDKTVIRQAYRAKLPQYHPETDPDGFKALREAYEDAMQYADYSETTIDTSRLELQIDHNVTQSLSEEELQANEICQNYQSLLADPKRCYDINQWHQFVASFYDYSMTVIDSVKWQLLEISYSANHLSLSCTKVLADNLRWRQQLMTQLPDQIDRYDDFLNQIEQGDYFNYATLSTISKTFQSVTLDYLDFAKWIFWERSAGELDYFLSQDTVIYLPNDEDLMLQYANWHCYAKQANSAILDYALSQLALTGLEPHLIIEWKYIVAQQYTLLEDKDNSLKYWLELYNSENYQGKSAGWIIYWCSVYAKDHLPLLIVALNRFASLPTNTTEDLNYTIPRFSSTTITRLVKLNKDDYPLEIADFIDWALAENWNYRQILLPLLNDDGSNRLLHLYRHAIMLRHGDEILLQEILEEKSDNAFELFIIQNIQRQAKQYLEWITKLKPIQQFKTWLYDNDEDASIPVEFSLEEENNDFIFARFWLDRFRHLPLVAKLHLYNYLDYFQMEMFDWMIFFSFNLDYDFPNPPYANDRDAYWQWYRYCMLVIALANDPVKIATSIKQNNSTFNIPNDSPILSIVNTIKHSNWQNENQLYNEIENDNRIVNSILINYPNSIESVLDDDPQRIDFYDIQQNIAQLWQLKLANHEPIYLMLLLTILLYKSSQTEKLHKILGKIADDSKELQIIADRFAKHRNIPFTFDRKKYHYSESVDKLKKLADRLSHSYGVCSEDEVQMLITFKINGDNDLVLRLCAALLLAKDADNKNELTSAPIPINKACQFWRWNGRANQIAFLLQLFFSFCLYRFNKIFIVSNENTITIIFVAIILINTIFAIKRRLNDHYNGERFFFLKRITNLPLFFYSCYRQGLPYANRYGMPIKSKKDKVLTQNPPDSTDKSKGD